MSSLNFPVKKHTAFLVRCLRGMPSEATSLDSNRMTLAYFLLASLDLLGTLETATTEAERQDWVEWVWQQQSPNGGFRGSPFTGPFPSTQPTSPIHSSSQAHLASSYTALLILSLLKAPLDRLDRPGLLEFVKSCQYPDGSFSPLRREMNAERDVRMLLCACVISEMLNDWSGIDVERSREFVLGCRAYEGGFGQRPGQEAQGGTTYCSLVTLHLLAKSPHSSSSSSSLSLLPRPAERMTISWLLHRQLPLQTPPSPSPSLSQLVDLPAPRGGGFQGRTGKKNDACYSWWCGGALEILKSHHLISVEPNRAFLLRCQSRIGGFAKYPDERPDPFHTYASLASLALLDHLPLSLGEGGSDTKLGLKEMDPVRNVGKEAGDWFDEERRRLSWGYHKRWGKA